VDEEEEPIRPAEAARDRRRDRKVDAPEKAGMRTGLAKQFKQVLDAQAKRAVESGSELRKGRKVSLPAHGRSAGGATERDHQPG